MSTFFAVRDEIAEKLKEIPFSQRNRDVASHAVGTRQFCSYR